jgi:hypothetical protein
MLRITENPPSYSWVGSISRHARGLPLNALCGAVLCALGLVVLGAMISTSARAQSPAAPTTEAVARTQVVPRLQSAQPAQQRRGSNRHRFVGLRWTPTDSWAWRATLRLDSASVTDLHAGGYVASTLWAATNNRLRPYGNSHGEPYVQLRHDGRYFEAAQRGVQLGVDYAVTLHSASVGPPERGTGQWDFVVAAPDNSGFDGSFTGAGRHPESGSVFAGIETTSKANSGDMTGSELGYQLVLNEHPFDNAEFWGFEGNPAELNPQLVRRGPGSAAWIDKFHSFHAHFGS